MEWTLITMKLYLTLAATVLALAIVSPPAWSEVTSGQAVDVNTGAATGNWSAALEKTPLDNPTRDLSKDLSAEARLLNDHLASFDKPGQAPDAKKPAAIIANPGAVAAGAKAGAEPLDDWGSEWANKIRDFIKPLHKGVVNSEVVQVVRELDAVIPKKRESDDSATPPPLAPLILGPVGPLTTEEQRRRDQLASSLAMEQLIDDIKPYAYGLLALIVIGYLGVVAWRFLSWKQGKSSKRISQSRAARQSRSRAGETGAAPLASRAAPLQDDRKNERLSP